jgi:hypothetical protein
MTKTFRNTEFFQYGQSNYRGFSEYEELIILFADDIKNELYNNPIWCIDGTLGVSPSGFCQVYTIRIIRSHHVIHIVYGIFKNKREETYVYFLKKFKIIESESKTYIYYCKF